MFNSKDNNLLYEAYASVYNSAEYLEESQHARENPEKYERSPEAREGRRRRSGINDPKTGINSPAFADFMAQQMGGKKKKKEVKEDVYQIILSYLLDEGYADNAHSAVAIMGNMSEEWRDSIVEGAAGAFVPSKVDDFNNRRDMLKNRYGQDVSPRIPGPSGGGQFEKPLSNPAGALRLAKTSSKGDTKTA